MPAVLGHLQHVFDIFYLPEGDNTIQMVPFGGWDERIAAGGDEQSVIELFRTVLGHHSLFGSVDLSDQFPGPGMKSDAILLIPGEIVGDDVPESHFSCQHGRKHNTVIVTMRLCPENADFIPVMGQLGTSSTVLMPAIPLPMTTNFLLHTTRPDSINS